MDFEARDVRLVRGTGLGRRRERAAHVRVTAEGLFIDDARVTAREGVTRALLIPAAGRARPGVWLETRSGSLELRVRDEAEARGLLAALGHGASQAAATWTVHLGKDVSLAWLALFFVAVNATLVSTVLLLDALGFGALTLPAVLAAAFAYALLSARAARVVLGADGVVVERGRAVRFASFADVERLRVAGCDARVDVRGAPPILLRFAPDLGAAAFASRFHEALDAFHARSRRLDEAALARGARDTGEWLATLRAGLRDGAAAYRSVPLERERLWSVVEDPAAESTARAGAAVILRRSLDDDGRARLRVAADACASPALRVALDAVLSDEADDDAIAGAFDDEAARATASKKRQAG